MNRRSQLAIACIAAAILSGIVQGLWEMRYPILQDVHTYASASAGLRWMNALFAVIKSVGFMAGLYALYLYGTKHGIVVRIAMILAGLGAIVFTVVFVYMAIAPKFTLLYVAGGAFFQMLAPVVLGIAGMASRRMPIIAGIVSILVGIANSRIFVMFPPATALIIQGVIWIALGAVIYLLPAEPV